MILLRRTLLALAFATLLGLTRVSAQEIEIPAGQDASAEPTPIPETRSREPKPPAEGEAEPEATPEKKKKEPAKTVEEMNPDEFKKAGLDKLSPDELRTLNEWLKGYRHQAEAQAAQKAKAETKQQAKEEATAEAKQKFNRNWLSTDRIFSRIDGEFHGLRRDGKKMIIVLEDGTVWKQANETDHVYEAKLTDHPPVMITHSVVGYKMHVIGAGEFYVNPVRPH
jgi:hypothetical protein